jgi:hypothetical protein
LAGAVARIEQNPLVWLHVQICRWGRRKENNECVESDSSGAVSVPASGMERTTGMPSGGRTENQNRKKSGFARR